MNSNPTIDLACVHLSEGDRDKIEQVMAEGFVAGTKDVPDNPYPKTHLLHLIWNAAHSIGYIHEDDDPSFHTVADLIPIQGHVS